MRTKPIKIDWEGLEDAFNEQREGLVFYLDVITGHVVLDGEGESDDLDADSYEAAPAGRDAADRSDDATRLYVKPPSTERKIEWMREFLGGGDVEAPVVAELEQAIETDDPAPALRDVLNRNPEVRDAWYRYRSRRIQSVIDEWVAANGVRFTDPPPWS